MSIEIATEILSRFQGRHNYIAYQPPGENFRPYEIKKPLTPEKFAETHFGGTCLGFYLMREDNRIHCTAVDFDNHDGSNPIAIPDAQRFAIVLEDLGLSPLVEVSQSGEGAHVWLFFSTPVSAMLVRRLLNGLLEREGHKGTEVYPRQDELVIDKDSKGLGNLIRFPLWNQSHFIDRDGNTLDPLEALHSVSSHTEDEIDNLISWETEDVFVGELTDQGLPLHVEKLLRESPNGLLAARWAGDTTGMYDPSRSSVVQSITLELVRQYVHPEEIEAAITFWCNQNDYPKGLRGDWQRRTVRRAYEIVTGRHMERKAIEEDTFEGIATAFLDRLLLGEDPVIPTGIAGLDESFEGFGLGEFTVISGRPGDGKTALIIQLLENAAIAGFPGLYLSLEMGPIKTARRLITRLAARPKQEWAEAEVNRQLVQQIKQQYAGRRPIHFIENTFHIDDIEDTVRQYVEEKGVRVVAVDYQQLATAGMGDEYCDQTEVSKRLKMLTNELQIAMIDAVMCKRDIDMKPDRDPVLADLKGTGQLEQDADLILFGRVPSNWDEDAPEDEFIVHVKKCRNRECLNDRIEITYDKHTQEFR